MTTTGIVIRLLLSILAIFALVWHLRHAEDPLAEEIEREKRKGKDPHEPPHDH